MKIKLRVLMLLLAVLLVFTGCGGNEAAENTPEPTSEVTAEPTADPVQAEIDDFFKKYVDTTERPVAVMVDNDDKNARPHAGLDEAYLIYEMVVEGGATRFMALYRGVDTEKIGPIRSSRHYFLDYMKENDAIYTHYGWSPKAQQDITSYGIAKINGVLGSDGHIFWREEKYKGDWHSAYTSIENIRELAEQKEYRSETEHKNGIRYSDKYITPANEGAADQILLKYSGGYNTGYVYKEDKGIYEKTIHHAPHVMQNGNVLEVKNIIIELKTDVSLGDGSDRRELYTTGSGSGYYITNGGYEKITWSKSSRFENTVYNKEDGTPLYINPGRTIVNVISPSADIIFTSVSE